MKLIERLKRITMGRIEAFLDSVEKPEQILPQLIREMSIQVTAATNAQAKALGAVKGCQRRFDETTGRLHRLTEGAELAAKANEIELARQAIAAQIQAEQDMQKCRTNLEKAEQAYAAASDAKIQLTDNLNQLKQRKDELIAKSRQVKTQTQSLTATDDILDTVARMEAKIDTAEAETQIRNEISKTLGLSFDDQRVKKLEQNAEVQRRLNEITKKENT
ncbi:MAG: PspA/IM30 family protein [Phycisphaerae bacterium]|nr:PspA/IM30 family protein [Phycisphaerae bacterium]